MKKYATVRKDLIKNQECPPCLKGSQDWMVDLHVCGEGRFKFRYEMLDTEETEEGYNMVIWLENDDFVDLVNSIDFDFI